MFRAGARPPAGSTSPVAAAELMRSWCGGGARRTLRAGSAVLRWPGRLTVMKTATPGHCGNGARVDNHHHGLAPGSADPAGGPGAPLVGGARPALRRSALARPWQRRRLMGTCEECVGSKGGSCLGSGGPPVRPTVRSAAVRGCRWWSGVMMSCLAERQDGDSRRRLPGLTCCGQPTTVEFRLAASHSCWVCVFPPDPGVLPGGLR